MSQKRLVAAWGRKITIEQRVANPVQSGRISIIVAILEDDEPEEASGSIGTKNHHRTKGRKPRLVGENLDNRSHS
ncbi:hypothetical protein TNCV_5137221 [Trichonephila clavipes]|nr:hypothetical protein TNCV_5137221 [Trichonephila clavipes]